MSKTSREEITKHIKYDQKFFTDLNEQDLDALWRKSMATSSHMKNLIQWHRNNELTFAVLAVRAFFDEQLVGWGYLKLDTFHKEFETGIYIQREYRKIGIGREIMEQIKDYHQKVDPNIPLISKPWDPRSRIFFDKTGIRYV